MSSLPWHVHALVALSVTAAVSVVTERAAVVVGTAPVAGNKKTTIDKLCYDDTICTKQVK